VTPLVVREVTHLEALDNDTVTAAAFSNGNVMVAYTRITNGSLHVRVSLSKPADNSPFQEEQAACLESSGTSCRHAWLTACNGDARVLFVDEDTPPRLRLTSRTTGVFVGATVEEGAPYTSPLGVSCDAAGMAHIFHTEGTQLFHQRWTTMAVMGRESVTTGAVEAASAVDGLGNPWVATVDANHATTLHALSGTTWSPTTLHAGGQGHLGVDLLINSSGEFHLCTADTSVTPAALLHIFGQPGAFQTEVVDPGLPGDTHAARCRVDQLPNGTVLISHVATPSGRLLLSRRSPSSGSWGTDDVAATIPALGPQDVVVDAGGRLGVVFISAGGRMQWAR
jgi:hypothetical protein